MHFTLLSCCRFIFLLSLLVPSAVFAADETLPDPYASLHPTDNIVALAKLRPLLAKSPDDQHLMGLALMCYVNLCLSGEYDCDGGFGNWLNYATTLAERRSKARGGLPAPDFASAEPELWVRLLSGYRKDVADALAMWMDQAESPRHRALFVLATTDWRSFLTTKPRTLHEQYAAMRTGFESGKYDLPNLLSSDQATHNPNLAAAINNKWGAREADIAIRENVTFTAWMLASSDLTDEQAVPLLGELGSALNVVIEPGLTRKETWRRVFAAAQQVDRPDPIAVGAALSISGRLLDQQRGIYGKDGSLRLYGLGDLAAWNRDWLYWVGYEGYEYTRRETGNFAAAERNFVKKMRERAPDSLLVSRLALGYQGFDYGNDKVPPQAWDAFTHAIGQELERENGHSSCIKALIVARLALVRPEKAEGLLRKLLAQYPTLTPPRAKFDRLVVACEKTNNIPLILPALRHWSNADPHDEELRQFFRKWSPETSLVNSAGQKPLRTWRDTQVNNRILPWPNLGLSKNFFIRWTGALHIEQAGSYTFATESDDGSRLIIGDVVVDNGGNHPMRISRMRADLEPGWLPLTLEFSQGTGEAGCHLLWQTPGSKDLVPIPASQLAEREGGPAGLVANGYKQSDLPPINYGSGEEDLAYARRMPWDFRIQSSTGNALWQVERYQEALEFYRNILVFDPDHSAARRAAQCLLWDRNPDVDAAIAIMRKNPDLWMHGWELTRTVKVLRRLGRL
jgi:tetratricopeptide (TPR) repeat protein